MNPLSTSVAEADFPPMSEVRKNLWIDWYRCPIDRKKLKVLAQSSDAQGFFLAIGHLAIWLTTAILSIWLFYQQSWVGFAAAIVCHGIVTSHFSAPHHELSHRTVFKTQKYNDFFLIIFSLLSWLNFRVYRFSHNYHHRYTLFLEGDREEILPVTPSLRALYLLQLFTFNITGGYQSKGLYPTLRNHLKLAFNQFDRPFNSWGTELYDGHLKQRKLASQWSRTILVFHAVIIIGAIASGHPIIALVVSGGAFIAGFHRYFIGVTMHCGLRSNVSDFRKCARSIKLDPLSEFLYWHMNWHLEHHMYAAVPCYNLKKLHHELADDMPQLRTLSSAWVEMRDTWRRQKTEPDYAYDTPVPTPIAASEDTDEELASSVGDLVNKEFADA